MIKKITNITNITLAFTLISQCFSSLIGSAGELSNGELILEKVNQESESRVSNKFESIMKLEDEYYGSREENLFIEPEQIIEKKSSEVQFITNNVTISPKENNNIKFESESLQNLLCELGIDTNGDNFISVEEALNVKSLTLSIYSAHNINSLKGIEYFKNLTYLEINESSNIEDYSMLGDLKNLENLHIWNGYTEDFKFLASLPKLVDLSIGYTLLDSISNITKLENLKSLDLQGNLFESISGISSMKQLETLKLDGGRTKIQDCSEIGELVNLKKLIISYNDLTNLAFISNLTELTYLGLSMNMIKDLTPIESLTKLDTLDLRGNQVLNLAPIARLIEKKSTDDNKFKLDIYGNYPYNKDTLNAIQLSQYSPIEDRYDISYDIWVKPGSHSINKIGNKYEIKIVVDDTDIDIKKIKLPNEMIIDGLEAKYTIDELSIQTFYLIDSQGKEYPYIVEGGLPIQFSDDNFKQGLLLYADHNSDGEIDFDEAKHVGNIDLSRSGITNIKGIEAFTNLVWGELNYNSIKSILPLVNLRKLNSDVSIGFMGNPLYNSSTLNAVHLIDYDIYWGDYLDYEVWDIPASHEVVVENGVSTIKLSVNPEWPEKLVGITRPDGTYVDSLSTEFITNSNEGQLFLIHDELGNEYSYQTQGIINFKDETFKEILLKKVDKDKDGQVSQTEAKQVSSLNLSGYGINDVSGIENFTNLTTLNLSYNNIKSVLPIAKLLKLKNNEELTVELYENPINDESTVNAVHLSDYDIYMYGELAYEVWETPANHIIQKSDDTLTVTLTLNSEWPEKLIGITLPNGTYIEEDLAISSGLDYSDFNFIIHDDLGNEYPYCLEDERPIQFTDIKFRDYLIKQNADRNNDGEISYKEAKYVTSIYLSGSDVSNINEIIYFKNLTSFTAGGTDIEEFISLAKLVQSVDHEVYISIFGDKMIKSSTPYAVAVSKYNIENNWGQLKYEAWVLPANIKVSESQIVLTLNKNSSINFTSIILPSGEEVFEDSIIYKTGEEEIYEFIIKDEDGNEYPIKVGSDLVIQFKNNKFKNLIINQGIDINNNGEISFDEALNLESLTISYGDSSSWDLSGLEYFRNLKYFSASPSLKSNLNLIQSLTKLETLVINEAGLEDISWLEPLKNIKSLDLSGNNISNISVLGNFVNLDSLKLSRNNISNISELANLTQLNSLDLSSNSITDLSSLQELLALKKLNLSQNNITDATVLENLKQLESLNLSQNLNLDISKFPIIKNITEFILNSMNLSELKFLKNYPNITNLMIGNNSITVLDGIENLKQLQSLQIYSNNITDILPLVKLQQEYNLKYVDLDYNPLYSYTTQGIVHLPEYVLNWYWKDYPVYVIPQEHITHQVIDGNIEVIFDPYLSVTSVKNGDEVLTIKDNKVVLPAAVNVHTLSITDKYGNQYEYTIEEKHPTNTAPVVTLIGDEVIELEQYETFEDPGAMATDTEDGELEVVVIGEVDPTRLGEYILTYTATDLAGESTSITRTVIVKALPVDLNEDGFINQDDVDLIFSFYNLESEDSQWKESYDLNKDGIIDLYDIVLITGNLYYK